MALQFFTLRPRFLLREVSQGDGSGALASVSILSVKTSRPGSTTGAFLQSVPHGHRDTNTGPGSIAPWPRLGITYAQAFSKKEQYQNNGNSTMIDNSNTNTPPRGPHIAVFLRRKKGKGRTNQAKLARRRPSGRTRAAFGAQADSLSRFTSVRRRADPLPPSKQARRRGGRPQPLLEESLPE